MNTTPESNPSSAPVGPQEERSYSLVLISGLVTTVLTLLGIYVLDARTDFHIMGLYANYILPVGAILVGVAASSGYGLASWFSGVKITRSLLWLVLVLQLAAYFAAQYIEFNSRRLVHLRDGTPVGFIEYFDAAARAFAWKQNDGSPGNPLGIWGYAFRGLEILGFAAGGLIVPLALRKKPYCQACQRYMRTRQLGLAPASVPVKKVKKSAAAGLAAYEAEQDQAFESGKRTVETLQQFAVNTKTADFQKALTELEMGKKAAGRLPRRFSLQLVHCSRCASGQLLVNMLVGQGKQLKQTEFARAELHPEFVRSVCQ
jgi:hypothetical protein